MWSFTVALDTRTPPFSLLTPRAPAAVALSLLLAACGGARAARRPPPTASIAITNVTVVDVAAGTVRPGMTVVVSGQRIASATAGGAAPAGAVPMDGTGRFLIPGLWDMHTHHQAAGASALPLYVANGVVGTRDMGSDLEFILALRDRLQAGELGPTIVAAGPMLDDAPADWPWRRRVADAAQATSAAAALFDAGVDFLKVHDHTPRVAYFAIAAEAKRRGRAFAGHVPSSVTVAEAAAAGQASIEHLANFRVFLECAGDASYAADRCAPLFDALAAQQVWQTPTLAFLETVPETFSGQAPPAAEYASAELMGVWRKNREATQLTDDAKAWWKGQARAALTAVADMRGRGVRFLAGCDALVPGFCLHDELEWLTRAGFTPAQALEAATLGPARFLGREASAGSVEAGKAADLVLLSANPLDDIRNTRRIEAVVLRGRLLPRKELDAILAAAKRDDHAPPASR